MFGRNKREIFIVEVDSDPKLEGKIYIIFSIIMAVMFAIEWTMKEDRGPASFILAAALCLFVGGTGVYFRYFRRKPRKINVVIGGRDNSLYVRSKVLYILSDIVLAAVLYIIVVPCIDFLFNGFRFTFDCLTEDHGRYFFIILLFLYHTASNYMGFFLYYKAPEKARRIL